MTRENKSRPLGNTDKVFLKDVVKLYGREPGSVLSILKAVQDHYHFLPGPVLQYICSITAITPQQITGVATFYSLFRHKPAGRHRIRVCIGTACHVKGAEQILSAFKTHLHIPGENDTDNKLLFTVEKAACLGCCMLAPAVQIDDTIYGHLTPVKVPSVVADFLSSRVIRKSSGLFIDDPGQAGYQGEIRMCTCSSCAAAGALAVHTGFLKELKQRGLHIKLTEVGCTGLSFEAPLVEILLPGNRKYQYGRVAGNYVKKIIDHHFPSKSIIKRLSSVVYSVFDHIYTDGEKEPVTRYALDSTHGTAALYRGKQVHIATEYCGKLGPVDLHAYVRHEGFAALKQCIHEYKNPDRVLSIIKESGLRGRGGAGFPAYRKWQNILNRKQLYMHMKPHMHMICNGDEGDPGAFMDRMLLESFPLRIIEGMLIAGITLGIKTGIIYIRSEYPLACERVTQALSVCKEHGFIGDNILQTDFSFSLKVIEGAGAFVCGEETALIESIEGRRGMPHFRPPYPSEKGLHGLPTLIHNVETFACIPWIIRNGPAAFARLGTSSSGGTKTFALAGKIERGGLIEVPMGISLREIVEDIGGGIQKQKPEEKHLKAILVGGPSGGCIPAHLSDVPVDFDTLQEKGAIMGSGGMVVLDNTDCMVEIARYFMEFTQSESCGKCTYCRIGTKQMLDILTRLTMGKGKRKDIEELNHLSRIVKQRSLCGLGKTAPNPILSTLRYFYDEYEAHTRGKCPAKKCKALITYTVTDKCIGCTKCAQGCPAGAILPEPYTQHTINSSLCIRCDACRQACPQGAIIVE